jgi:hypothetical protein
MTPLGDNRGAKAVREENAILKQALHAIRADPEGAEEVLDGLDDRLGVSTEPITLAGLKSGQFDAESLVGRMDEVEAVLTGRPVAGQPATADDVRRMTAEQVADFGAERALAILNGEAER